MGDSTIDTFQSVISEALIHAYSDANYWNNRYKRDPEPFDWYQPYSGIKHILRREILLSQRILMVGCGNSELSQDMIEDGYRDIVNIDISGVVIAAMKEKYPKMIYEVQNVCNLPYDSASFDAVIDKGTLDAILCGPGSLENADKMLSHISRILKPGGVFILITYGRPQNRMCYLDLPMYSWSITRETAGADANTETVIVDEEELDGLGQTDHLHFIYLMRTHS